MILLRCGILICLCSFLAPGETVPLNSAIPRRFSIAPQSLPFVVTGISVPVPPGASRLTIDLETEVPTHDLSLWSRFDRDVTVQAGTVTAADFSAQTPASGIERLVITPLSSPPLQTGTYYVAIGVPASHEAIRGTITATIDSGGTGTFVISTFDFDAEGWSRNYPDSTLPGATVGEFSALVSWVAAGGAPNSSPGNLGFSESERELKQDSLVAPPKFLGNLAGITNPRIEFDYRHTSGQDARFALRVLVLGNGSAFAWESTAPPSSSWTHFRLPLNTVTFRRVAGTGTLEQVLSNVQRIEISMDQAIGAETNAIDNFAIMGDVGAVAPSATPATPVTSTFDTDTDGWGRNYPPSSVAGSSFGDSSSALSWLNEGGTAGGVLVLNEPGAAADDYFVAPAKFLGNLAALQGPVLEFDYRHAGNPSGVGPLVVRLLGAGSSFRWVGAFPGPGGFQHYRVPLDGAYFVREFGTASFAQMMAGVQRIEISADQSAGSETDALDNVALLSATAPPPPPPVLSAAPGSLSFNATAGAANPAPQTFQITSSGDALSWTAVVNPQASWLSISPAGGSTPGTLTVTVNSAGLARGSYSASITIAAGGASNTPQSVTVNLTVLPSPDSLPRVMAGSIVNAGSFRAPVAAGSLATLFGLNLGPTEGITASFLPGTQMLPTTLGGVRVLVRDSSGSQVAEAPLLFVKNTQINFQMPSEAAGRSSVVLVVDNNGLLSTPETVSLSPTAPGLFIFEGNRAVAQNQDFSLNTAANPTPRGGVLFVYLTGVGTVSPAIAAGQVAPASPLSLATRTATATIGGVAAPVLFLGLTPGLVGVAQANILVSDAVASGDQMLLISIDGQTTNGGLVSIR